MGGRSTASGAVFPDQAIWLLRVGARTGSLHQRVRKVLPSQPAIGLEAGVLSPTGRITYAERAVRFHHQHSMHGVISAYRTASGAKLRGYPGRPPTLVLGSTLQLSASGRYLLSYPDLRDYPGSGARGPGGVSVRTRLVGLDLATGKVITISRRLPGGIVSVTW